MKKGISLFTAALLAVSAIPLTTSAQTQIDLNGDGLVNGYDANLIIERYMEIAVQEYNSPVLTDEIRVRIGAVADLNGDGKINTTDSTMLLIGIIKPVISTATVYLTEEMLPPSSVTMPKGP